MPKYYAKSTSITLSVADLFASTTATPLRSLSPTASRNTHYTAEQLALGPGVTTLSETPVYNGGSHIGFLGGDMPFFIVQAGKNNKYGKSAEESREPNHAEGAIPVIEKGASSTVQDSWASSGTPLALCVTVSLSKASFFRHYDANLQKTITEDIKMDVFLNGELCASTYVSERHCNSDSKEFGQRFSGQRIDRLLEKPWILMPPSQATNVQGDRAYSAKARWDEIGEIIKLQAMRLGGQTTVLGEYLSHIADLQMPAEVKTMQWQRGLKFAIIDVVISKGKGQKNEKQNDPWLKAPTPMRLKRPSQVQTSREKVNTSKVTRRTPAVKDPPQGASSSGLGGHDAAYPHNGQYTTGATLASASQSTNGSHTTPGIWHSPRWEPTSKWRGAATRADAEVLAQSEHVLNGPRTRATYHSATRSNSPKATSPPRSARKQPANLQPASSPTPAPRLRTTKSYCRKPPSTKAPVPETPQKVIEAAEEPLKGPPAKRQRMRYHDVFDNKMTLSEEIVMAEAAGREGHSVGKLLKQIETSQNTAPVAVSSAGGTSTTQNTFKAKAFSTAAVNATVKTVLQTPNPRKRRAVHKTCQTSSLTDDCVVSYANGPVRQIKMERSGWFEETGILMGVRFLIG